MQNETWKPVVGIEERYEVSDLGRVRSAKTKMILKTTKKGGKNNAKKYDGVTLSVNGKVYGRYVHRLVAAAFIGPCPIGEEVLHGPGGSDDNSLANIRYGTHAENQRQMISDNTVPRGSGHPNAKLDEIKVAAIKWWTTFGCNETQLAKNYGVNKTTIYSIKTGKTWAHVEPALTQVSLGRAA